MYLPTSRVTLGVPGLVPSRRYRKGLCDHVLQVVLVARLPSETY